MNEIEINGFSSITEEEMLKTDGGIILTSSMIGAMVIWGVNLGLASWGVAQTINK